MRVKVPRRRWETRCVPGWDSWSPEEIRALQNECLRRFVNQSIYALHPYYHRLFDENKIDPRSIKTVDDLKRIPFTYKEDIVPSAQDLNKPRGFVLAPVFDRGKAGGPQGWTPG
jgi:phenylacetate-coenzyme A ligase PaaK-like adenylate-forming protein